LGLGIIILIIVIVIIVLHLCTFKTPTFALKKIQKCKINIDGLTFKVYKIIVNLYIECLVEK